MAGPIANGVDLDGEGRVMCFVSLGDRNLQEKVREQGDELERLKRELLDLQKKMSRLAGDSDGGR